MQPNSQHFTGAVNNLGGSLASKTTTVNTYVDVEAVDVGPFKTKVFTFTATTNDLLVQILGSEDGGATYLATPVEAEFSVSVVGSPVRKSYTGLYTHLKPQVKPAVADVHGTLATTCMLTSLS